MHSRRALYGEKKKMNNSYLMFNIIKGNGLHFKNMSSFAYAVNLIKIKTSVVDNYM